MTHIHILKRLEMFSASWARIASMFNGVDDNAEKAILTAKDDIDSLIKEMQDEADVVYFRCCDCLKIHSVFRKDLKDGFLNFRCQCGFQQLYEVREHHVSTNIRRIP